MDVLQIAGVHGIRQGSSATTPRLSSKWQKTVDLAVGASKHAGAVGSVELTVPSYQEVYPKTATRYMRLGPDQIDDAPVDEDEESFILEALAAYAPTAPAEENDSPLAGHPLGEARFTPRILRRAHAVDQVAGKGVTGRLLWLVREAHDYLRHEETAAAVRAKIRGALIETGARMVIAHSLGSVVFYDMLSRGEVPTGHDEETGVTTFVTCGSPLSWLCVRKGVHAPGAPLSVPANVEWTNLHSPNDVVNKGAGLSHLAAGVTDVVAHNGGVAKAHDVHRYLAKEAVVDLALKTRKLGTDARTGIRSEP
ncbi:hypothetical protein ABZ916_21565 [Streptomyces sp. NPDC046853]|uniref:hypothetical protein n=1 Tax=Streptomyces sp. NPDC046853 TaxID=3154920 RepID=UPI0033FF1446